MRRIEQPKMSLEILASGRALTKIFEASISTLYASLLAWLHGLT